MLYGGTKENHKTDRVHGHLAEITNPGPPDYEMRLLPFRREYGGLRMAGFLYRQTDTFHDCYKGH